MKAINTVWHPFCPFAVPMNAIRFQRNLLVAELAFQPDVARVVRLSAAGRGVLEDSAVAHDVPTGPAATVDGLCPLESY